MTIHAPEGVRERIMGYGPAGSGKSKAYVDIYLETDTNMYVVDTDVAVERMFRGVDQSRLTFEEATDWESAGKAMIKMARQAKAGDWLVLDLSTPTWQWCQDFWVSKTQKGAGDDLTLWVPKDDIDYDWQRINSMYNAFTAKIMATKAHVYVCAEDADIVKAGSSWRGDLDDDFEGVGAKPAGQKRTPYQFHSIYLFRKKTFKNAPDKYDVTAAKERVGRECDWNREEWTGESFAQKYLVDIAEWQDDEAEERPKRKRRRQS